MQKNKVKSKRTRKIFFILICLLYITVFYPRPIELYQLRLFYDAAVLFYTDEQPVGLSSCFVQNNGLNYEITTDLRHANSLRASIKNVTYQTVIFNGSLDYVKRYLGLKNPQKTVIGGGVLLSGYSGIIKGGRLGSGDNVQIYCKGNLIYIGNPVIFGSY
ncbi:MAG: hypothetical protein PHE12_02785 [Clostridia bacterium]|nr:hypothetical protein [Clostridia bacterium]